MLYFYQDTYIILLGVPMKKKLPIGISDFAEMVSENYFYVDKTLFIKEVLDSGAKATLIPRPRRFGKTLNLSMLRYFFEKTEEPTRDLFKGLAIEQDAECMAHQGQYPVVFLTFKDVKEGNWESCYKKIQEILSDEFKRHKYLLDGDFLMPQEKKDFSELVNRTSSQVTCENSLKNLSSYLAKYHNKRPIILIDEYDSPIHAGFKHGYYDEIVGFMRGFLCAGLKDNSNLEFSVMTGILRIAKESIFSGLNNLKVCSLFSDAYSDKFGLTEAEVQSVMKTFDLPNKMDDIRSWYNGYSTGRDGNRLYNPWSIINCVDCKGRLQPYWVNTSDNQIVKDLIRKSGKDLKEKIELLLEKKSVRERINETIVFQDIYRMASAALNFLLFTGYLTYENYSMEDKRWYANLRIPNDEVDDFYRSVITSWFEGIIGDDYALMLKSLVGGDIKYFKKLFKNFAEESFSYFDVGKKKSEKFYHAFVLGMLVGLGSEYEVRSNRESGYGRYDVMVMPKDPSKLGIVFEFKTVDHDEKETLELAAQAALKQIEDKQYEQELRARGINQVLKLGIAFEGKEVLVLEELT
jgi:hypothetical protein